MSLSQQDNKGMTVLGGVNDPDDQGEIGREVRKILFGVQEIL